MLWHIYIYIKIERKEIIHSETYKKTHIHTGIQRKKTKRYKTTKQSETVIFEGYLYAKHLILYDIILLYSSIVGHDMLPKYLSLNV